MTFEQAVAKVQDIMKLAKPEEIGNAAIQIHFTNKDCEGTMYISSRDGQLDIAGYDYLDNDAAIDIMYGDLSKILSGRLSVNSAIEKNLLNVVGNVDAVMAIAGCAKKPAVKKTDSKKTTAKKTVAKKATPAADKTPVKSTSSTSGISGKEKAATKSVTKKSAAAKKTETKSTSK